jgi:hypothetical protein
MVTSKRLILVRIKYSFKYKMTFKKVKKLLLHIFLFSHNIFSQELGEQGDSKLSSSSGSSVNVTWLRRGRYFSTLS